MHLGGNDFRLWIFDASKEVTARQAPLGGAAQISTSKYPRIVFAVAVSLDRALDLSDLSSSEPGKAIVCACLSIDDLTASMARSQILEGEGIQGLVFPSEHAWSPRTELPIGISVRAVEQGN